MRILGNFQMSLCSYFNTDLLNCIIIATSDFLNFKLELHLFQIKMEIESPPLPVPPQLPPQQEQLSGI